MSANLYALGDVTKEFREIAGKKGRLAMDKLLITVYCERLPCTPDVRLAEFVSQPNESNFYAVHLDGRRVCERLEMPRDALNIIAGIGIGRGVVS